MIALIGLVVGIIIGSSLLWTPSLVRCVPI